MPVREATAAEVTACHGPDHMTRVASNSALAAADAVAGGPGRAHFSIDTYLNQHTLLCARLAAGACADVAAAVVRCATCSLLQLEAEQKQHIDHVQDHDGLWGPVCLLMHASAMC